LGQRLNFEFKDLVPRSQIVPMLKPLFRQFTISRHKDETFGDFCLRLGKENLETVIAEGESLQSPQSS
jgi:sulfite reductase (ferredoxin)